MFCSQCGTDVPDDSAFCHNCGTRVVQTAEPPPSAQVAGPPAGPAELATQSQEQAVEGITSPTPPVPSPGALAPEAAAPVQPQQPPVVVMTPTAQGPNLLVRALWYIFFGSWLGLGAILIGWLLNLTIVGLPLGLYILNRLPQLMTLHPERKEWKAEVGSGVTAMREEETAQYNFWIRAVYFVLVGWWLSLAWLLSAWMIGFIAGLLLFTIIAFPISAWLYAVTFWMVGRSAFLITLRRT